MWLQAEQLLSQPRNKVTESEWSRIKENWIWAEETDIIVHVTDWEKEFYQEQRGVGLGENCLRGVFEAL